MSERAIAIAARDLGLNITGMPKIVLDRVPEDYTSRILEIFRGDEKIAQSTASDPEGRFSGAILPDVTSETFTRHSLKNNPLSGNEGEVLRKSYTVDEIKILIDDVRERLGKKVAALSDKEMESILRVRDILLFSDPAKQHACNSTILLEADCLIPFFSELDTTQLQVHGVATGNHASIGASYYLDPLDKFTAKIVMIEAGPHYGEKQGRALLFGGYAQLENYEKPVLTLKREFGEELRNDQKNPLIKFERSRLHPLFPDTTESAGDAHTSPVTIVTPFAYNLSRESFYNLREHGAKMVTDSEYRAKILLDTKQEVQGVFDINLEDALKRGSDMLVYPDGFKILEDLSHHIGILLDY